MVNHVLGSVPERVSKESVISLQSPTGSGTTDDMTNHTNPQAVIEQMRQAGLTDAVIRLAVPDLADVLDVHDEPADEITAWAQALEPEQFTDAHLCELALSDTMRALQHPTLWLEACEPIGYRAELASLAQAQFSAWLDAVR